MLRAHYSVDCHRTVSKKSRSLLSRLITRGGAEGF